MSDPTLNPHPKRKNALRHREWVLAAAFGIAMGLAIAWAIGAIPIPEPKSRQHTPATGTPALPPSGMTGMDMGATSGEREGGASVHLTASQLREFGVTYETARVRLLEGELRTVGVVAVDETKLSQVTPRFGGYVERLYVESTGQRVRKGEPLMDIYSPELLAAQEELLAARNLERSIATSDIPGVPTSSLDLSSAAKRRLELWGISDAQVTEVLRTGKPRRALTLHAPASGIVLQKNVVQGQAIRAGESLYTIVSLSDVWVEAKLREYDAGSVRVGSRATMTFTSAPGQTVHGRVEYVYPTLDSTARTVTARIVVPNPSGLIRPGMYGTVVLSTPSHSALAVPTSAVINTGDRSIVFVDMGNGELMPHEVEVGRIAGDLTEIVSGIEPGQRVVTSAQFLVDSESNLAEVMRSMIGQMGNSANGHGGGLEKAGESMGDMPGMHMPPDRR